MPPYTYAPLLSLTLSPIRAPRCPHWEVVATKAAALKVFGTAVQQGSLPAILAPDLDQT